jgi:hypothetical protein
MSLGDLSPRHGVVEFEWINNRRSMRLVPLDSLENCGVQKYCPMSETNKRGFDMSWRVVKLVLEISGMIISDEIPFLVCPC